MKTLVIDSARCVQCCNCQIVCKDEYCDSDWSPIAKPQGQSQFWIKIIGEEMSTGTRVKTLWLPLICQHCKQPSCKTAAPDAVYQRKDGYVIIDPEKAKGKKELVGSCPYGVIYWNAELELPQKCTMCAHLLDNGWSEPRCVTACPTEALRYEETDSLTESSLYAPLEILNPEYGTEPQVYYQNLPKPFVGGTIVDMKGLTIIGARITATHQIKGKTYRAITNAFGDFDIRGLVPGYYTIEIDKDCYYPKSIKNLDLNKALNLEEITILEIPSR